MFSEHVIILLAAAGALLLLFAAATIIVIRRRRRRRRPRPVRATNVNSQFAATIASESTPRSRFSRPIKVMVSRKPDGGFGLGFYGCASATAAAHQVGASESV